MNIFNRKYGAFYFIGIFILVLIISLVIYFKPADDYIVTFINVGQGDSAVIKGKKSSVLIDAGTDKSAAEVKAELDRLNIKRLDLVALSHYDSDHISGMSKLINDYEIKRIIAPKNDKKYLPDSTSYDEFIIAAENKNIPVKKVKLNDKIKLADMEIDVISPCKEYCESNEDSAVLRIRCGSKRLLFTGDASDKVEKDILINNKDISADILKAGHHGSRTSTSEEFLNAVNPSFAVVSVSKYNTYNLPNIETMKRLYGYGCKVLRTDEMGNITLRINGGKISWETEKA